MTESFALHETNTPTSQRSAVRRLLRNRLLWVCLTLIVAGVAWRTMYPPLTELEKQLFGSWTIHRVNKEGISYRITFTFREDRTFERVIQVEPQESNAPDHSSGRWRVVGHEMRLTGNVSISSKVKIKAYKLSDKFTGMKTIDPFSSVVKISFDSNEKLQLSWFRPAYDEFMEAETWERVTL